jgi:hypothetical protein
MRECDSSHGQRRRDHQVTVWQSVTAIDTWKNELRKYCSFEEKVGCHDNRLAQSKPDQSYVVFNREDVGCRAPWRITGVLSQFQRPRGTGYVICVLSARLRIVRPGRHGSEAVTLGHPVMPVANGLGRGLVGINGDQL